MTSLKKTLFSPAAFAIAGLAMVVALIFVWGPAITIGGNQPLEGVGAQMMTSMLMAMAFGSVYLGQDYLRSAAQRRLSGALAGDGAARPDDGQALQQELRAVADRFRAALQVLRKRRFGGAGNGRRWLYQLPWYVVIGPPGSGKTTAITHSGLSFPLADRFGKGELAGIGGTRNCDWWFTDDAVLIDTAGRYMTQDSDTERDKAAWLGFLRMLRRNRRRQPLNGVLVSIGISELLAASEAERQDHAARMRNRVEELYRELGLRLPIYVLLTKFDLIAGFVEFFEDLGKDGRSAVWGVTFPYQEREAEGGPLVRYAAEFDALVGRLDARLLERVHQESDLDRRALVFGFPQQVASLKGLIHQFLQDAFAPNSFDEPVLLRGIYFVSGTQVGTPLDRVAEATAQSFGLARRPSASFAGKQRSYFLRRLLNDVVFPEAGLVEESPGAARRRTRLRLAACAAAALLAMGGIGLFSVSYARNAELVDGVRAEVATYTADAERLALEKVEDADLNRVLPLLDRLRALVQQLEGEEDGVLGVAGLDQRPKLAAQARQAYRRALNEVMLPRLILRLEQVLVSRRDDAPFLYEAFKLYLIFGRQGPLRRDAVRSWMALDWRASMPAPEQVAARMALEAHLDTLLQAPLASIGLNGPLVEQVRGALQKLSQPRVVLSAILSSPEAVALPAWRIVDVAGPAAQDVLRRQSGQPLSAGIAGIFTTSGFHGTFLKLLPAIAQAQAEDRWVFAAPAAGEPVDATPQAARRLQDETTELYLQEFSLHWDQVVNDIAVARIQTLSEALRVLNVLAAPTSPIRLLLTSVVAETALDRPPGDGQQAAPAPGRLEALFRTPGNDTGPAAIAARFAIEHFRALRQLVEVPPNSQAGAQAPIDDAIRDLDRLYRSLSELQGSWGDAARQSEQTAGVLGQIERRAAGLPLPIRQWVLGVSRTSSDLSVTGAQQRLGEAWRQGPGQFCQRAVEARFPFSANAGTELSLGDFGRLLGPDGTVDSFVNTNLKSVVDTSRIPWSNRRSSPADFRLTPTALAQFQRAAAIRDSLFQDGGSRPAFSFSLAMTDLSAGAEKVVFELDGRRLEFARGDAEARQLRWPGAEGAGFAAISFIDHEGKTTQVVSKSGGWGLFRLLAEAGTRPLGNEATQLRIDANPRFATFVLTASSLANPFAPRLLSEFRCPPAL